MLYYNNNIIVIIIVTEMLVSCNFTPTAQQAFSTQFPVITIVTVIIGSSQTKSCHAMPCGKSTISQGEREGTKGVTRIFLTLSQVKRLCAKIFSHAPLGLNPCPLRVFCDVEQRTATWASLEVRNAVLTKIIWHCLHHLRERHLSRDLSYTFCHSKSSSVLSLKQTSWHACGTVSVVVY